MPTGNEPTTSQLGVVLRNIVPLRAKPDADSEQTSQALIGQPVALEGGQGDWLFVKTWDTYRGWISSSSVQALDQSEPYASSGNVAIIRELFVDVHSTPNEHAPIITKATISAEIEVIKANGDWVELRLPNGRLGYIKKHEAKLVDKDTSQTIWLPEPSKLLETAMRFISVPYLWGGTSPFGLDCSGFVQLVHKIHGVTLLRNSRMQADDVRGLRIEKEDVRAGDIVFFGKGKDPDTKGINHVGIAINNEQFIHSSGQLGVNTTTFDNARYADIFWGARRMRLATLDFGGGVVEE